MSTFKIAVTGCKGQVVQSMIRRAAQSGMASVIPLGRPLLDLGDAASVQSAILAARPDVVVNAAAYTAVDQAEDEPELAFQINEAGARAVAAATAALSIPVIQLSTDYVFEGKQDGPLSEDYPTHPQSVYGASKLAGETAVAAENPRHVILRTAWVYSPFGKNFVKTMFRLAGERDVVRVVCDQFGNPTSALDLADGILHVASALVASPDTSPRGVFHIAGSGEASWANVAEKVMAVCEQRGQRRAEVRRVDTNEFPTKARRPADSRLNCAKLLQAYGWSAPQWQSSLAEVVGELADGARRSD